MIMCSRCHQNPRRLTHRYCASCHANYVREWRKTHRLSGEARRRMNARSQANHCRRRGILKPEPCEITGCADPVQMHHDDYSKPLEVRWLCKTHHQQLHAALRWPMDGPQSMSAAEIAAWAEAV